MNTANDLLTRCLHGHASPADWQSLDAQIVSDPVVARQWCEGARLDAELERLFKPADKRPALLRRPAFLTGAAAAVVAAGGFAVLQFNKQTGEARGPVPVSAVVAQAGPSEEKQAAPDSDEERLFARCEEFYAKRDLRALALYEKYASLYPDGKYIEDAYFKVGECHFSLGHSPESAIQQYDRYLREFPAGKHLAAVHFHTGEAYTRLSTAGKDADKSENTRKANDAYRACLKVTTKGINAGAAAWRLAGSAYAKGRSSKTALEEAVHWFSIAAPEIPADRPTDRAAAYFYMGCCQRSLRKPEDAAASFQEVVKIKADNPYLAQAQDALAQVTRGAEAPAKFSRVNTAEKVMALTFNAGPHETNTPRLLKILKDEGVKATFLPVGANLERYKELARQTAADGHELGNHTWTHSFVSKLDDKKLKDEIGRTGDLLHEITGRQPDLFRPPYGAITPAQVSTVKNRFNCNTVMWSVDSMDWKSKNAEAITKTVMEQAAPGGIVLLHEIHSATIDAMPGLIKQLKAGGWKLVTVTELRKLGNPAGAEMLPQDSLPPLQPK